MTPQRVLGVILFLLGCYCVYIPVITSEPDAPFVYILAWLEGAVAFGAGLLTLKRPKPPKHYPGPRGTTVQDPTGLGWPDDMKKD